MHLCPSRYGGIASWPPTSPAPRSKTITTTRNTLATSSTPPYDPLLPSNSVISLRELLPTSPPPPRLDTPRAHATRQQTMSFAPAAPLARAASKLRSSLDHSRDRIAGDLHTAEELYAEARRTEEDAEQAGEELPEELNPREAEEIIAEEYRPLMEDGDAEEGRGRSKRSQNGGAQGGKVKVRKLEVWIAYLAFFVRLFPSFPPFLALSPSSPFICQT